MVIRSLKASCHQVYVTVGVQNKDQIQDGNLGFSQTLIKLPISVKFTEPLRLENMTTKLMVHLLDANGLFNKNRIFYYMCHGCIKIPGYLSIRIA